MDEPILDEIIPAVTTEEAWAWIERLKAATLLSLLKDPDHAMNVSRAFFGYRPDAKSYGNTLVRSRLVQAAVKDSLFAKKLRELSEAVAPPPGQKVLPENSPTLSTSLSIPKPDKSEALRIERDQRRRERDEARLALSAAEAERDESARVRLKAEIERDEAQRQLKKLGERVSRLERQTQKQQQIEAQLFRALNQDKVSLPPTNRARTAGKAPSEPLKQVSPWLTAVHHLLDKSKFDLAMAQAADVLKADPEDSDALDITIRAWEGRGDLIQAGPAIRRLLGVQIIRQEMAKAADTLGRLLKSVNSQHRVETDARRYLSALSPENAAAVEAGRRLLTRLKGSDPAAYTWLTTLINAHTTLGPVLMPPPGALGPDDPLPLKLSKGYPQGQPLTARLLTDAVDQGMTALVEATRTALTTLETVDPKTFTRFWAALEQAAGADSTRLLPLKRKPRGPIVVDSSNVGWFDQESLTHGKPRLRNLHEIRRLLRGRGFFPVILYADANLPYFIDEPEALRQMIGRNELLLVDGGTVADEVLLRVAKQLTAPILTNDKMEDWDPEGEVPKVRYSISSGGEAHLLTDI